MIMYIDVLNHKHENRDGNFVINVDEVEYAECREIILGKDIRTRSYKFSRKVLVFESDEEEGCVCVALDEEYSKLAAKCEKILFRGPKKTLTVNIQEEDMLIKRVVLGLGKG